MPGQALVLHSQFDLGLIDRRGCNRSGRCRRSVGETPTKPRISLLTRNFATL